MNNHDIKLKIQKLILNRDVFSEQTSKIQIRTRCPFCGDSQKNLHTGHLYLRINPDDNLPIVYNCFKCPAQGILKYEDLESLGISDDDIKKNISSLNKTSDKFSYSESIQDKYFEYKIPDNYDKMHYKIEYVENRLNHKFSNDELKNMRVITSLKDFLLLNNINKITCKPYIAKLMETKYVGFLSNNNAYILFRDITEKENIRWFKYRITEESQGQKLFYSLKSSIDLYTKDEITINLSEGVLDCLSIAYNLNNIGKNVLNIAVCGNFYLTVIRYLIGLGLIGSNVSLNIYSDNDHKESTSIEHHKRLLKKYTYLFKEINVYYNTLSKDCGVPLNKILLNKTKI